MNPTTSAQALSNLTSFQSGMQKPEDILNSQEQSLGVPQAQTQVQGLRGAIQNTTNLLNQVAPSVYGRTQNSLETNAQATRNIENEQAPITTTLNKQNTDYNNQESDLQNLLSKAGTLAGLKAQGQDAQFGYLKDIYSALYGQEQDTQAEADKQAALKTSSSGSSNGLGSILGSLLGGTSSAPAASYGLKSSGNPAGGYYFRDASGSPISALKYSQLSGTPFDQLIQKMASSGDTYAKSVVRFATPNGFQGLTNAPLAKLFTG